MVLQPTRHRFTVAEYHQMAQAGILSADDRVELIDGEIIEMTPIGRLHMACVIRLTRLFERLFADVALTSVQNPLRLGRRAEPEPDLTLLRLRSDFYRGKDPAPEDVLLLIEVADTSVEWDRRVKVPLYARHGILEVWLVDLQQDILTVYQDPGPRGYRTARVVRRGDEIAPSAFPDRPLAVADILG